MLVREELEEQKIQELFEEIVSNCRDCNEESNRKLLEKAFHFAYQAHKGLRRKTGEPYIVHPLEVAKIITTEIGLGTISAVCALLHDVAEDTEYEIEDVREIFGDKIATIVDGLTKIEEVIEHQPNPVQEEEEEEEKFVRLNSGKESGSSLQAENFRKLLLTLSNDVRVVIIKIADRLHNMRTLYALSPKKQMKIAAETLYWFAPLAHRLGLYLIKVELEDLSFKYRNPETYYKLSKLITEKQHTNTNLIIRFALPIVNRLISEGISFEIKGRPKSAYSTWKKMKKLGLSIENIFDLLAIRIIFNPFQNISEKTQCWIIYSIITEMYKPNPERTRDWISRPKSNGYESLHTTVQDNTGRWFEVQIRSRRMHEIAERGYAAHWKYKSSNVEENELDKWLSRIAEALNNQEVSALTFLDEFRVNFFSSEVEVFTPKGHLKILPKDSTVLDFAFLIHSDLAIKAIGAKVNNRTLPINHVLNNGDKVEILTSDNQTPKSEWLNFVITTKAINHLKTHFAKERKQKTDAGKEILNQLVSKIGRTLNSHLLKKIYDSFEVKGKDELYYKIGNKEIGFDELKQILKKSAAEKWIWYPKLQFLNFGTANKNKNQQLITPSIKVDDKKIIFGNDKISEHYKIASCCNPIPGDKIVGHQINSEITVIHRIDCPEAIRLNTYYGENIVQAEWTSHKQRSFLTSLKLSGIDRVGLVSNIATAISKDLNVNMRAINFESFDGKFSGKIDLYVYDNKHLSNLMKDLSNIKGVKNVQRIEQNSFDIEKNPSFNETNY